MSRIRSHNASKVVGRRASRHTGWQDENATFGEDGLDDFDGVLDREDDFVADDDVAFLGEDYDVLELEEVLELCNMPLKTRLAS